MNIQKTGDSGERKKKVMEDPLEGCEGIDTVGKMGESTDTPGRQSRITVLETRGPVESGSHDLW